MKEKLRDYLQQLSKDDIIELFLDTVKQDSGAIPLSIFAVTALSALELVVRYLKGTGKKNKDIAEILGRSQQVVWTTNKNAEEKYPHTLPIKESSYDLPIDVLRDNNHSILESIVVYLKEGRNLRYSEIGGLLHRDQRTIWTTYNRAKKKDEEKKTRTIS